MSQINDITVPPIMIKAIGALILVTLLATAYGRYSGMTETAAVPAEDIVEQISLSFVDQNDGSVSVIDAATGQEVGTLLSGGDGFARGVLRGLVRERRLSSIGSEQPFQLFRTVQNDVTLFDPATGRLVALRAFGPTNDAVFRRFLKSASQEG